MYPISPPFFVSTVVGTDEFFAHQLQDAESGTLFGDSERLVASRHPFSMSRWRFITPFLAFNLHALNKRQKDSLRKAERFL